VNAPQQKINKTNAAFEHGHQLLFLFWVRIFLHISKIFPKDNAGIKQLDG